MLRKKLNLQDPEKHNDEENTDGLIIVKKPRLDNSSIESLNLNLPQGEQSKYFSNTSIESISISQKLIFLQRSLNNMLEKLSFLEDPVDFVYNPTVYAVEPCEKYLHTYCDGRKRIIFLGMNPGPWGMCQTGVPFGEVTSVRDWLQIEGEVTQPEKVCSFKKIEGFNCKRKEVSGDRFWNYFKELCGTPEIFFKNAIVYNYCPIALLKKNGGNVTPAELKISIRKSLHEACDKILVEVIKLLEPEVIIGIGKYALDRANIALKSVSADIKSLYMLHPSPRSAKSNNWAKEVDQFLKENDLIQYFQSKNE